MDKYWQLVLWDGETILVKPQNVKRVQDLIDQKKDVRTGNRTIIKSNIKDFVRTDKPYSDKQLGTGQLLEDAAVAFQEPLLTESGDVKLKAVKRYVQRRRWDSYYSQIHSYKLLEEGEGQVLMGFWIPVHAMTENVMECTEDETKRLTNKII